MRTQKLDLRFIVVHGPALKNCAALEGIGYPQL